MYIKKKGLFIVLEGIDGSGKTYHGKKLYLRLKKKKGLPEKLWESRMEIGSSP